MVFKKGARYVFTTEYDLEGFIEFTAKAGFDFVQLGYEAPLKWVGEISLDRRRRIRTLAKDLRLQVCVHSVANGINVAWINSRFREESLKQVKESIEFTYDVGAELLTTHPGWKDMYGYRYPEEAYALAIEGHQELAEFAASYGVRLGVENMPPGWTSFCVKPDEVKAMIEAVDWDNFGITLDVGHANILGADTIDEFITPLADKIFLVHLHDNDGKRDHHRIIGEGTVDFHRAISLLEQASINAPLCIEAANLDDVVKGKQNLEQILIGVEQGTLGSK